MSAKFTLVGSGLAGGLLAGFLGRRGYEIDLFERRSDPRAGNTVGGRSINLALSTRGIHALEQLGLADEVLRHAIPMRGRMIHDPDGALHFSPYDRDPNKCINSIGRDILNTVVIEAAQRYPNVRVHFNQRCTDVDLDEPAAQFVQTETGAEPARCGATRSSAWMARSPRCVGSMQRLNRFEYSQSYLAARLQGANHSARRRWLMADGKKRPPYLAAPSFHDDRAA